MSEVIERRTSRALWHKAQTAGKGLWQRVKQASACRECGCPVNPLASVCQRCGTGNPFKIGVSPQLLFTAVACEIVLLVLGLRPS
ncbi:MAG TPA: hypothetical protein VMY37_36785 [Thermoguttaceae bacterium]|nr:hypothetical protein [Thermoguttaceae bacterium]